MFELPATELTIFLVVIALYTAAAVIGVLQVRAGGERHHQALTHLFTLAVVLQAVMLLLRGLAIQAAPLTGLFESMLVLTLAFATVYLLLGIAIRQAWFGALVTWVILAMILLTAVVAAPAARPQEVAGKPWAVAHALAMVLGATMVLLAAVTGALYLLGMRWLKHKQLARVFGRMPSIERLQRYNRIALNAAFVLVTLGLVSGIGGAWMEADRLGRTWQQWLTDPKLLGIGATWLVLGMMLAGRRLGLIRARHLAAAAIVFFVVMLFALVGVTVWGLSQHNFSSDAAGAPPQVEGGGP